MRYTSVSPFLNKPKPRKLSMTFVRKFCIPTYSNHNIKDDLSAQCEYSNDMK